MHNDGVINDLREETILGVLRGPLRGKRAGGRAPQCLRVRKHRGVVSIGEFYWIRGMVGMATHDAAQEDSLHSLVIRLGCVERAVDATVPQGDASGAVLSYGADGASGVHAGVKAVVEAELTRVG